MRYVLYTVLACATLAVVAYYGVEAMRFHLPTPLHHEHAGLEDDCFSCHEKDRTVDAAKCADCHTDPVTGGRAVFRGFARHHEYADLDCLECHTEHQGVDGDLTKPDHAFGTGDCSRCHARHLGRSYAYRLPRRSHPEDTLHGDHRRWQADCFTCHLDEGGTDSSRCTTCHEPATERPVVFAGFALHHLYEELDCLECHLAHQGRQASLLRPGKSLQTTGCGECHERHVGPDYAYVMGGGPHPQPAVHPGHAPWAADCSACHREGTAEVECLSCHDPETGEQVELEEFAGHHFREDLDCLDCHTEHRGEAAGATTREGHSFADIDCLDCHAAAIEEPSDLSELSADVRGESDEFLHTQHPRDVTDCAECHAMEPEQVHTFVGPYDRHCSDCHHGEEQEADCAVCHLEEADYMAGRFEGRLIARGQHGRSGDVACADCHVYAEADQAFGGPETTCESCHPAHYTPLFETSREEWDEWRERALPPETEDAKDDLLHFIGRNWYHNPAHAEALRRRDGDGDGREREY